MISSAQPHEHRCKVEEREEIPSELFESERDTPVSFDALEEVLDEAAVAIEMSVVLPQSCAGRIRWNHDRAPVRLQRELEGTSVVGPIANDVGVLDAAEQFVGEFHLVRLTF